MPRLSISSFEMGDHDRDWFIVMSRLDGISIRASLSVVATDYVAQQKNKYLQKLEYTARKYGLTVEECFQRLLKNESLGEPVNGTNNDAEP